MERLCHRNQVRGDARPYEWYRAEGYSKACGMGCDQDAEMKEDRLPEGQPTACGVLDNSSEQVAEQMG
eukprot:6976934-Prorocentrum_lima.AAC.1